MNIPSYPRYVIPAVLHDNDICFKPPARQHYILGTNTQLVWKILDACDGYRPITAVLAEVQSDFSSLSPNFIREAIQELTNLGILEDSRAGYSTFHDLTTNPPYFSHNLSAKEIRTITESSRLPTRQGTAYDIHQQTTSRLAGMQRKRRSVRSFSQKTLRLDLLGHILVSAYSLPLRTSPSAGALYPLKIYVIVTAEQADMPVGYYEYDPATHKLMLYTQQFDYKQLQYAFNSEHLLGNTPVIVVIAADLQRDARKYGDRGYRFTILEAGHATQNMHLAAAEKRVSSLEYGGFLDNVLQEELQMDKQVWPLITVALGFANKKAPARPSEQKELLETLKTYLIGPGKPVQTLSISHGFYSNNNLTLATVSARAIGHYATRPEESFVASGTAASVTLAQVKALAEAYERFCSGLIRVDRIATAHELTAQGEQWIDPRQTAPFTEKQLSDLSALQRFKPDTTWQWVEASRVAGATKLWVPVDMAYYPLYTAPWKRKRCLAANSSGVAAHTTKAEAVRRGLLELVERHALMQHWFSRRAAPQIPSKELPYHWQRRVAYWQARGRHVCVLDISTFGVIVTQVIITSSEYPCFITGAAASLSSFDEALTKAFTEAELPLSSMISQSPRLLSIKPEQVRTVADHGKLYASPQYSHHLSWLCSGPESMPPSVSTTYPQLVKKLNPAAITLSPSDAPLYVIRVLSEKLIPITFGYGAAHYSHAAVKNLHPDSIAMPHYFV